MWRSVPEAKPRNRRDRGFTLLEVLVALMIAAVTLGALFHLLSAGAKARSASALLANATALAEAKLTLAGQWGLSSGTPQEGEGPHGLRWRCSIEPLPSASRDVGKEGPLTAYEAQVIVSWGAADRARSITLRSLVLEQHR